VSGKREQPMQTPHNAAGSATSALRRHWPEYLIEGWALGSFMLSAAVCATLFDYPGSALHAAIASTALRRAGVGAAMGLTAIALIYSPWGQRSGAHMNPAVTLTFWRLGKMARYDALFYITAQCVGGTIGVLLASGLLGAAFTAPPVRYAVTVPGTLGTTGAVAAELAISALLMWTVLRVSNSPRYARYTGLCAGMLVALFITFEGPLSGMSMNPARTLASALPAHTWTGFWIYVTAPIMAMQAAATLYLRRRGAAAVACAKLLHPLTQRCIHCGHVPTAKRTAAAAFNGVLPS
jgi:aquaporin Z